MRNHSFTQNPFIYSTFGMVMPARQYNSGDYRYGFNGQEKDDEILGQGNHNTALYWEYDTRIGRRWNIDPKPTVGISEYACFGNNSNINIDENGDYYVGIFGQKVNIKQRKDGTIRVGWFASRDLKNLVKLTNASGSQSAMDQILEGGKNKTKIYVKTENEVRDQPGQLGYGLAGLHQAHDKDGKPLVWDSKKGDFNGTPAYVDGEDGVYKEATVTIFKGNIESYTEPGKSRENETARVFQHEVHHDTDKEFIKDLKNKREGKETKNMDSHENIGPQDKQVIEEMDKKNSSEKEKQ